MPKITRHPSEPPVELIEEARRINRYSYDELLSEFSDKVNIPVMITDHRCTYFFMYMVETPFELASNPNHPVHHDRQVYVELGASMLTPISKFKGLVARLAVPDRRVQICFGWEKKVVPYFHDQKDPDLEANGYVALSCYSSKGYNYFIAGIRDCDEQLRLWEIREHPAITRLFPLENPCAA